MSKLKNIFKQAQKNEKLQQQGKLTTNNFYVNTNGMSYKDFKKAMKQNGWSADSKEAKGFFYEQLNPEPEETVQKIENPYIVGLGETLLPIAPVTPTGVEKVIVKEASTKPVINSVKTVVNPIKAAKKVSQPEQQVIEVKKVVVPANPGSLDPTYYDTNENQGISFDWNKMNEEFGGLSPEQVQDLLNYQQILKNHSHKHYMFPASWGAYKTHYFQKGGSVKQSSQQDAVKQFVKALAQTLQKDIQSVTQDAIQHPKALKSAVKAYQDSEGDIQKAAQAFSQAISSETQVAKHGAKLNYLKSLKNKCAEDEELYYFKKGGSMGCGCKKKEQGGELKEKKESTVSKFKKACGGFKVKFMTGGQSPKKKNLDQASKDSIEINDKQNMELMSERPGKLIPNPKYDKGKTDDRAQLWVPDRTKTPYKKEEKVKKDCGGSKMKLKKGDKVCPKCGKVHAAGAGCMLSSVKKFKMHKQGGSLNGVPFIRKEIK